MQYDRFGHAAFEQGGGGAGLAVLISRVILKIFLEIFLEIFLAPEEGAAVDVARAEVRISVTI